MYVNNVTTSKNYYLQVKHTKQILHMYETADRHIVNQNRLKYDKSMHNFIQKICVMLVCLVLKYSNNENRR